MNHKNRKICRLCLKIICNSDFDIIEDFSRYMLEVLLLKMVLDVSKDPVMCNECSTNLQRSFDFKSFCLNTESMLQTFSTSEDGIKLSLIQVYLKENRSDSADILEDQKICRICILPVEIGRFMNLHETKEDIFVLDILQKKIPEVDLSITEDPAICKTCHQSFQDLQSFIKSCCNVEETIIRYIEMNGTGDTGQIDLNNLQNSTLKSQSNDDCNEMQLHSVDEFLKTEIKDENCMEVDHLELTDNQEETKNILEQNNSESFQEPSPATVVANEYKCAECKFETKYRQNLTAHLVSHENPSELKIHKCPFCTYETNRKRDITRHMIAHKKPLKIHKCPFCTYETNHKRNITRHMVAHKKPTEVTLHKCVICNFTSKYRTSFNLHLLTHKDTSEVNMSRCPICTFETKYKKNLKRHMLIHKMDTRQLTRYECESCTFKTNNKIDFRNHILSHKNLLEAVKCKKCGHETNDKHICEDPLETNLVTATDKIYKCTTCTYATNKKSCLKKHRIQHKDPSEVTIYTCDICSYQSQMKDVIENHTLIHKKSSEVALYRCETCSYETKYKSVLKSHRLTHQKPQSQRSQDKSELTDTVKDGALDSDIIMFKCDTCSYESKYKADVKKHVLIHMKPSGVTMYKCQTCIYESRFKSAFRRHMLVHRNPSEVLIYKCEFCSHKTKYKSKIEKHMLTHYNVIS